MADLVPAWALLVASVGSVALAAGVSWGIVRSNLGALAKTCDVHKEEDDRKHGDFERRLRAGELAAARMQTQIDVQERGLKELQLHFDKRFDRLEQRLDTLHAERA